MVDSDNHFLYLVQRDGKAIRYGITVGEEAMAWSGIAKVGSKTEWPAWHPTPGEIARLGLRVTAGVGNFVLVHFEPAPSKRSAPAADAFLMDDVLLYGLAAARPDPKALKVVGRFVTTEPLAIMLPKNDPEFKKLVDEEMRRLITSREIYPIYDKWFNKPIPPNNTVLNLPVSYLLRDFWKYPTDQVPF